MEVSYLVALVGGILALLSPCAALLLPAFFAYAFGSPGRLLARTGIFYLGLITTLIPLGVGIAGLGRLLAEYRLALITGAGWLIIAVGVAALFGSGFDISRLFRRKNGTPARRQGALSTYLLGMVSGVAGACTGPILGAVLTVAAFSPSMLDGGILLAIYGLGMTIPLFLLSLLWDRLGSERINRLRGRQFRLGRLQLHTVSFGTGVALIALGIGFLMTDGFVNFEILSAETGANIQNKVFAWFGNIPDPVVILGLAIIALSGWYFWHRKKIKSN